MTDEEKAHLSVQMRLFGIHSEWIEFWWKRWPREMEGIYQEGVDAWWAKCSSRHEEWQQKPSASVLGCYTMTDLDRGETP